jgi:hypothetical protein
MLNFISFPRVIFSDAIDIPYCARVSNLYALLTTIYITKRGHKYTYFAIASHMYHHIGPKIWIKPLMIDTSQVRCYISESKNKIYDILTKQLESSILNSSYLVLIVINSKQKSFLRVIYLHQSLSWLLKYIIKNPDFVSSLKVAASTIPLFGPIGIN